MANETKVITPKFRVSFPNVFEARKNELSGADEYSLVALFPKDADLSALKKAAEAAAEKKWGPDPKKWPKQMRTPFRDQAERAKDGVLPQGMEEGAIYLNLKSKQKPQILDQAKKEITDPTEFYAGCYARASINAYAYDQKGNKGIAFGLGNLQKMADGERLGGRSRAVDDFEAIEVSGDDGAGDLFS